MFTQSKEFSYFPLRRNCRVMKDPQLTPTKTISRAALARREIQELLQATRGIMARQELLKQLWHLDVLEERAGKQSCGR
jgi:hypothetical protein